MSAPSAVPASASAPPASASASPNPHRLHRTQTTPSDVAVRNLNAQISGAERRFEVVKDLSIASLLVDLLLSRTQYLGSYDDFDRALEVASAKLKADPKDASAHLLHAKVLAALHRFEAALAATAEAEKLGAKPAQVVARRDSIWLAQGKHLDQVLARRKAEVEKAPGYATLTALAAVQVELGQFTQAEDSFVAALAAYRDVSPFPVAWVTFQRGVMWAERADKPELGRPLYEEAVRRLPEYVVASVHLAEMEHEAGDSAAAERRLTSVLDPKRDPEPSGFLGELLVADPKRTAEGERHVADAKARYDVLLKKYPEAFADHASEFFVGPGKDPKRGLQLAELNLKNRGTARAYLLAINAAQANQDTKRACELRGLAPPGYADPKQSSNLELVKLLESLNASCPKP